jgi:hypothetical protein
MVRSISDGSVETTSLTGPDRKDWAQPAADLTLNLNGVPTGWPLQSVTLAVHAGAVHVAFDYVPLSAKLPSGVTLTRTFALKPGRAAMSVRHVSGPMVYELTGRDPVAGKDWLVLEPWHSGSGYLFAFRQDAKAGAIKVRILGVNPATSYT